MHITTKFLMLATLCASTPLAIDAFGTASTPPRRSEVRIINQSGTRLSVSTIIGPPGPNRRAEGAILPPGHEYCVLQRIAPKMQISVRTLDFSELTASSDIQVKLYTLRTQIREQVECVNDGDRGSGSYLVRTEDDQAIARYIITREDNGYLSVERR